jgi:hypothetical protein
MMEDVRLDDLITPLSNDRKQDIRDIAAEIFSDVNMNQKSDLEISQIHSIAVLKMYAEKYKSENARLLVTWLLELRVSKKARGRGDLVNALRAALVTSDEANTERRRKLLGL